MAVINRGAPRSFVGVRCTADDAVTVLVHIEAEE